MQPLYGSWFGEGLLPPVARCVDPNAAQAFGVFDNIPDVSNLPFPAAPASGTCGLSEPPAKRMKYPRFVVRCVCIL